MTGQFVQSYPLYLNNRPQDGRAGFYLLMPMKIAGSDMHVLVARGWLPRNAAEAAKLPPYATPAGTVTIDGIVKTSVGHIMQLGTPEPVRPGAIVQNIDPAQFAAASGLALQPFFIEQAGPRRPTAWCATGRRPRWASRSTRAMLSNGMRWQRWRSSFL